MVGYWNHSNNSLTNKGAPPFVTPTSHSMLHRTLLPSSLFSAAPLRPSPPPSLRPQQQPEMTTETSALKRDRRSESAAPPTPGEETGFFLPDDAAWAVEEFLVDELLDFDGLEDSGETFEANAAHPTSPAAAAAAAAPVPPPPLADINLPTHDAEEFEWMSSIIDDTLPEYPAAAAHAVAASQPKTSHLSPPPQPPLEALCRFPTSTHVHTKAKRSKRARSAGGAWPRFGGAAASVAALSDYSTASTTTTNNNNSSSSSCSSSPTYNSNAIILYPPPPPQPKKRGRKPKLPPPPPYWAAARGGGEVSRGFGERRCTHCGSQKTPQWRTGPTGPKTLCNACGVRYKSGRLVPEYRPAASPTFVSHVHSNSHRKVLEMRRSKAERHHLAVAPPVSSF